MCILNILMGENFYIRYTYEVFNVAGKERHVMSLANSCYKRVFNANVQTPAFQGVMNSGCLSGSSFVERYNSDIFKQSVYKIYSPSLLDSIKKLIKA